MTEEIKVDVQDLNDQMLVRREKMEAMRESGLDLNLKEHIFQIKS